MTQPIKVQVARHEEPLVYDLAEEVEVEEISAPIPEDAETDLEKLEREEKEREEARVIEPGEKVTDRIVEAREQFIKLYNDIVFARDEFIRLYGREPQTNRDILDVMRIANGEAPQRRSDVAEAEAAKVFERFLGYAPDAESAYHQDMIDAIAYGYLVTNRNLEAEQFGVGAFASEYRRLPESTHDWNIVKFIGYLSPLGP